MEYYIHTMQQVNKQKRSYLSLIIIGSMLAVLLFLLVIAIGAIVVASQFGSSQTNQFNPLIGKNPLGQLDVENIDPALALSSLGGVPETIVIKEAIDKARPETALASLLFGSNLSNKETAGGFLRLAYLYANNQNNHKALFSYSMAGTVATLSSGIPDTGRADILLQAGEGLIALEQPEIAMFYLNQAFVVAANSPYLQAAHRRAILERLQKNYIIIEERALARESLSLSANAPNPSQIAKEQLILPKTRPISLPEAIQTAEGDRWRAAQELAVVLVDYGGNAPQDYINALSEALVVEDLQKSPFFESELNRATQLSQKVDLTLAKINWLSIKYRVARQAYGLSLVPEWETQAEQIRSDLTKSYETLFALGADLIIALPEASQIDKATEQTLRNEVLAGELGRYPNYPEEQRRKQLLDATEKLKTTQPEIGIFVSGGTLNDENVFKLVPLE